MRAFPANFYFYLKPGKHDVILMSFMANVSKLASFPFARMCKINNLEGAENLVMIRTKLGEMSEKNERGRGQK